MTADVVFDDGPCTMSSGNVTIRLTRTQLRIVKALHSAHGRPVSISDRFSYTSSLTQVYVVQIRRLLAKGGMPYGIHTVHGEGYALAKR